MRIPKYRKHSKGRGFVEHHGRRIYLPGAYNSAESRAAYAKFLEGVISPPESDQPASPAPADMTLCDLGVAYLDHLERAGTKAQYYHARCLVRLFWGPIGFAPLTTFGPKKLLELREAMLAEQRDPAEPEKIIKAAWSRKYINAQVQLLRRMIRWGAEQELAPQDLPIALGNVSGLKKGRTLAAESKPVEPAPLRTVAAIRRDAPLTIAAMIATQYRTGMRSHHLCALRVVDLDMTGEVWIYRPRRHLKGNAKALRILIGPKTQAVLAPLLDRDELAYIFSPRDTAAQRERKPGPAVRECYDSNTYRQAINHVARGLGIEPFHPHQLRHSAGTRARKELGLETAQAVLGHDRIDVTQIYAEKDLRLATEYAKRFG